MSFERVMEFFYIDISFEQEGFTDPPSVSSISRLLRGGRPGDDGKKDYTIDGILGGGEYKMIILHINIEPRLLNN